MTQRQFVVRDYNLFAAARENRVLLTNNSLVLPICKPVRRYFRELKLFVSNSNGLKNLTAKILIGTSLVELQKRSFDCRCATFFPVTGDKIKFRSETRFKQFNNSVSKKDDFFENIQSSVGELTPYLYKKLPDAEESFFLFIISNGTFYLSYLNKTPAEQRDISRPKLFYNYTNLRLKNGQFTIKTHRSSKKRKL